MWREDMSFISHSIYTLYIGKLMTEPFFCAMSELWEHSNEKVEMQCIFLIKKR